MSRTHFARALLINSLTKTIVVGVLSHFLVELHLGSNKLTGSIPTELGNLSKLGGLELNDNLLSQTIPSEIGKLLNMSVLLVTNNELSGEVPPKVCELRIPGLGMLGTFEADCEPFGQYGRLSCPYPKCCSECHCDRTNCD
jgi:hypothetical protein